MGHVPSLSFVVLLGVYVLFSLPHKDKKVFIKSISPIEDTFYTFMSGQFMMKVRSKADFGSISI